MQRMWHARGMTIAIVGLVMTTGCGRGGDPSFKPDMNGRIPSEIPLVEKQQMVDVMADVFGTPNAPKIPPEVDTGLDQKKLELAAGPSWRKNPDEPSQGLYRRLCAHCHGVTGGGDGPTALFLKPYPRDFRRGIFKFKSTERSARPTTADLKRTLRNGLPGSAMPSFALLPEDEIEALVEYVKYLSIRGQLEEALWLYYEDDTEAGVTTDGDVVFGELAPIARTWQEADTKVVVPDVAELPPTDTPELWQASVDRGRALFRNAEKAQCIQCHGPTGLGDGGGTGADYQPYDDWNKPKLNAPPGTYFALPIQEDQPRNLHLGVYRGGRRPVDLYRRIYSGINGTPMPELRLALKPNEIWDLVNYVLSIPYEDSGPPTQQQAAVSRDRL